MVNVNCECTIKEDIEFILENEDIDILDLSYATGISRTTLMEILKTGIAQSNIYEKFYSYIYRINYRINSVKEEFLKETNGQILFHGSKNGLKQILSNGSKRNCDFGEGFYLGETYIQALSFVYEKRDSFIYSFNCDFSNLKIKKFNCDLEWMLTICYFRGYLKQYENNRKVIELLKEIDDVDLIIAPIADNKMFYIMSQFSNGEINVDVAIHSLSASNLGYQYVIKSELALEKIKPIEKYYICNDERLDCKKKLSDRSFEIDTKLKLALRKFRNGLFIEEIFNEGI